MSQDSWHAEWVLTPQYVHEAQVLAPVLLYRTPNFSAGFGIIPFPNHDVWLSPTELSRTFQITFPIALQSSEPVDRTTGDKVAGIDLGEKHLAAVFTGEDTSTVVGQVQKAPQTEAGTWQMLNRLGVSHTRGQGYALSPDEQFKAKLHSFAGLAFIDGICRRTRNRETASEPTDRVFYLDDGNLGFPSLMSSIQPWTRTGLWPVSNRQLRAVPVDREKGDCLQRWTQRPDASSIGRSEVSGERI